MTRIYAPNFNTEHLLILDLAQAHYLRNVLRMKVGAELEVFDGKGQVGKAVIAEMGKALTLKVQSLSKINDKLEHRLHLVQALTKPQRIDWLLQKATELGVSHITLVDSLHGFKYKDLKGKLEHWNKIIIAACAQSAREILPKLEYGEDLTTGLRTMMQPEE